METPPQIPKTEYKPTEELLQQVSQAVNTCFYVCTCFVVSVVALKLGGFFFSGTATHQRLTQVQLWVPLQVPVCSFDLHE